MKIWKEDAYCNFDYVLIESTYKVFEEHLWSLSGEALDVETVFLLRLQLECNACAHL